eukprot:3891718-Pleurochrysis_carterae.AAC.1
MAAAAKLQLLSPPTLEANSIFTKLGKPGAPPGAVKVFLPVPVRAAHAASTRKGRPAVRVARIVWRIKEASTGGMRQLQVRGDPAARQRPEAPRDLVKRVKAACSAPLQAIIR